MVASPLGSKAPNIQPAVLWSYRLSTFHVWRVFLCQSTTCIAWTTKTTHQLHTTPSLEAKHMLYFSANTNHPWACNMHKWSTTSRSWLLLSPSPNHSVARHCHHIPLISAWYLSGKKLWFYPDSLLTSICNKQWAILNKGSAHLMKYPRHQSKVPKIPQFPRHQFHGSKMPPTQNNTWHVLSRNTSKTPCWKCQTCPSFQCHIKNNQSCQSTDTNQAAYQK